MIFRNGKSKHTQRSQIPRMHDQRQRKPKKRSKEKSIRMYGNNEKTRHIVAYRSGSCPIFKEIEVVKKKCCFIQWHHFSF